MTDNTEHQEGYLEGKLHFLLIVKKGKGLGFVGLLPSSQGFREFWANELVYFGSTGTAGAQGRDSKSNLRDQTRAILYKSLTNAA